MWSNIHEFPPRHISCTILGTEHKLTNMKMFNLLNKNNSNDIQPLAPNAYSQSVRENLMQTWENRHDLFKAPSPDFSNSLEYYFLHPHENFPYYIVMTCGLSDHPMTMPPGMEKYNHIELCIVLPPDWKLPDSEDSKGDWKKAENYWPLGLINHIASAVFNNVFPVWAGSTISNGDTPYAANTTFTGALLVDASRLFIPLPPPPKGKFSMPFFLPKVGNERITFLQVVPLYEKELAYIVEKNDGGSSFLKLVPEHEFPKDSLAVDIYRQSYIYGKD